MMGCGRGGYLEEILVVAGVVGLVESDGLGMGSSGKRSGDPGLCFGIDGHKFHPVFLLLTLS